jgi:hypothetical protein
VHIGDRESDIYELYCLAEELGTNFLVRSCVDRLAQDGKTTIAKVIENIPPDGTHEIRFRDAQGREERAVLEDQDILPNPENRMPDRGTSPDHGKPVGQLHRVMLRRCLAGIMADDPGS